MELVQKSPVVLCLDELIPPDAVITSVEGKGLVDKDDIDLLAQDAGLRDMPPLIVLDDYEKDFVNEAMRHEIESTFESCAQVCARLATLGVDIEDALENVQVKLHEAKFYGLRNKEVVQTEGLDYECMLDCFEVTLAWLLGVINILLSVCTARARTSLRSLSASTGLQLKAKDLEDWSFLQVAFRYTRCTNDFFLHALYSVTRLCFCLSGTMSL